MHMYNLSITISSNLKTEEEVFAKWEEFINNISKEQEKQLFEDSCLAEVKVEKV
jgi:hypothetical protein